MQNRRKNKKPPKYFVCIAISSIIAFIMLTVANPVHAEIKTFTKEYTYQASEEDSKNSSKVVSLREVKRLLLEELGTYLENITEVKNFQLTKDQIVTLTAGIVSTEVMEETWDGKVYWLKARISADPQGVIKSIDKLRQDRQKVKELEEVRKRSEALLQENERLKKELMTAKGKKKQKTAQAYKKNIDSLTADEWFERGHSLFMSRNHKDAVEAFNKAIKLNPQYVEAYHNRGAMYDILGNQQQAIKDYDKAIKLNPQYALSYFNRGVTYGELGNYQQAIKDYDKAIELNPQEALVAVYYYNRGLAYSNLGNYHQAIKDYDKVIELNPQEAKAYIKRGIAYYDLGNQQQAIKDYDKAIKLNPQYALSYFNRGVTYGELGNYQQAIKDLIIAARLGNKTVQDFFKSKGLAW